MPIRFEMRPVGGGSGGGAYYRFSKSGTVQLAAGEEVEIIPSTSSPVRREISIKGENPFSIRWDGSDRSLPVFEDATYFDSSDGGISLFATSATTQTVELWVRQETEIDYDLGQESGEIDDMPMPNLSIRPFMGVGNQYVPVANAIFDAAYWEEIGMYSRLWHGDYSWVNGILIFQFDVFFPGQMYNFTINPSDSYLLPAGEILKVFLVPREIMAMLMTQIVIFKNELYFNETRTHLTNWVKQHSEVATVESPGGGFSVVPTMSRQLLFFDTMANEQSSRSLCSCSYTPNLANPKEGGEFIVNAHIPYYD
ncbi:hypothetical protein AmaxDRAFT_3000 [Limnospira maxima CS-328]|uniref:Uncharacterized protein n=2 Tax=Limnospira TaxID=2596745 RepID=B5W2K2_LIMMA|nr:hypothetical protein [Limnospira maxima]EDZ94288.1 hypothetical protein AmaxDRAFT_3000 [Limnospira maxima CS-328]